MGNGAPTHTMPFARTKPAEAANQPPRHWEISSTPYLTRLWREPPIQFRAPDGSRAGARGVTAAINRRSTCRSASSSDSRIISRAPARFGRSTTIRITGVGAISVKECTLPAITRAAVRPAEPTTKRVVGIIESHMTWRCPTGRPTGNGVISVKECTLPAITRATVLPAERTTIPVAATTIWCMTAGISRGNRTGAGAISVKACTLPDRMQACALLGEATTTLGAVTTYCGKARSIFRGKNALLWRKTTAQLSELRNGNQYGFDRRPDHADVHHCLDVWGERHCELRASPPPPLLTGPDQFEQKQSGVTSGVTLFLSYGCNTGSKSPATSFSP